MPAGILIPSTGARKVKGSLLTQTDQTDQKVTIFLLQIIDIVRAWAQVILLCGRHKSVSVCKRSPIIIVAPSNIEFETEGAQINVPYTATTFQTFHFHHVSVKLRNASN